MEENIEYVIDFILPKGKPGYGSFEALTYITFQNQINNGSLTSLKALKIPRNTNIFNVTNNIIIEHTGCYIFTISGLLKESGNTNPLFNIQLENNGISENLITVNLNLEQKLYFSQTKVKNCQKNTIIKLTLQKANNSDASLEGANLIIKKLPL